jgi:DNA processing protein
MNVKALTLTDGDIPKQMANIPEAPLALYCRGLDLEEVLSRPLVAIVGSRKVDSYGAFVTSMLAKDLAELGVTIVSGLALGVDALAHAGALKGGGQTIAVLPCGIDSLYPRTNATLGEKIKSNGVVMSENSGTYIPHEYDFLRRNRLISGLSSGVIITQAAARSGSLNTARHALEQGRTVMAVPGPITNALCEGTNTLLKMGATPVTCAQDVLLALNISVEPEDRDHELLAENQSELDIIKALKDGVHDAEDILVLTKMTVPQLNTHLTIMEIRGVITPLGGNHWSLR